MANKCVLHEPEHEVSPQKDYITIRVWCVSSEMSFFADFCSIPKPEYIFLFTEQNMPAFVSTCLYDGFIFKNL